MKLITNGIDHIVTADTSIHLDSYTVLKQAAEKSIQKTTVRERSQQDKKKTKTKTNKKQNQKTKNVAQKIEFPNIFKSNIHTKTQSPRLMTKFSFLVIIHVIGLL